MGKDKKDSTNDDTISKHDKVEELAKRRGFFWQSSEIHGSIAGFYDYGPMGAAIKRKWENLWRAYFLKGDNFYEIEASNIMPKPVFVASGHLESFVDPIVKCKKCKHTERADQILEEELKESFEGKTPDELLEVIKKHKIKCRSCGGFLEETGILNMMFPLNIGVGKNVTTAYLRPETAQSAYVNFSRSFNVLRKKLPLGLAIIGRAYRNEISPRNALLRMREFTQAELQIFFDSETIEEHENWDDVKNEKIYYLPSNGKEEKEVTASVMAKELPKFYVYYLIFVQRFFLDILKIPKNKFRFRELSKEERAFYNKNHFDVEILLDYIGWKEVGGVHYRTDHDLSGHSRISKQDLSVQVGDKKVLPHVLELSFGVDRNVYSLMHIFYEEEQSEKSESRTLIKLPRILAPYDCAVFPLVSKDGLGEKAKEVKSLLQSNGIAVFYDDSGSVGRRYRRVDEIGVPLSITCDYQTLQDKSVTIRDRDTMKQVRVKVNELADKVKLFLNGAKIEDFGKVLF